MTIRLASDGPQARHAGTERPAGRLLMMVKSVHVYETERGYLLGVLAAP